MKLTACMLLDYGGAWIIDVVLKRALADVKPRESESLRPHVRRTLLS